ncbi:hypothetical protein GCM10022200_16460 [Microbacterium awajiense]|uniref:Glutaminase n=1 Tax=Microbacterium awajiense TaxID=415214 RepID=A0ABP7AKB7_9MICO
MAEAIIPLLDAARRRLAHCPREALGELIQPRRLLGISRAPRIVRRGAAWHLGTVLLADDRMLLVGEIVRARPDVRRGYTAQSQRERAGLAAAAHRGGFAEGEIVHLGWQELDLDAAATGAASGPLRTVDGVPMIRWSTAGGYQPLERYLDDRIELALHAPDGTTDRP